MRTDGRLAEVQLSMLRQSLEGMRKSNVDHTGHLQGILEADSSQEAISTQSNGGNAARQPEQTNRIGRGSDSVLERPAVSDQPTAPPAEGSSSGGTTPEQARSSHSAAPDQAIAVAARGPESDQARRPEAAGILEAGKSAFSRVTGAVFGGRSAEDAEPPTRESSAQTGAEDAMERGEGTAVAGETASGELAVSHVASDVSEAGSGDWKGEEGEDGGIAGKLRNLKERFSLRDGGRSEADEGESEQEREKLHLTQELKQKLKEKVRRLLSPHIQLQASFNAQQSCKRMACTLHTTLHVLNMHAGWIACTPWLCA